MKVYIITGEPFPHGMAGTNRIINYAKGIIEAGTECEVIVYTRTERHGHTPKNTLGKGVYEGIPFRYAGNTPLRHSNVLVRKWNDRMDRRRLYKYLDQNLRPGDVVIGYLIDIGVTEQAITRTRNRQAKYVRELCELPFATATETKQTQKKRKYTFDKIFPRLDGFICISENLEKIADQYKSAHARTVRIPILVDCAAYIAPGNRRPYIFHSGTMYEQKDGYTGMIEAFAIACRELGYSIEFVSTGTLEKCPSREKIEAIIREYGIEKNITFTGFLSSEELRKYQSAASLVIINKLDNQQNRYCFSTKLSEYLASSLPVITTSVGEANNYLEDGNTAYIVEPGDPKSIADRIVRAFTDDETRQTIAQNGRRLAEEMFDYRTNGRKLVNFLKSL